MDCKGNINLPDGINCMACNNCVISCHHDAIRLKYDFWGRMYPSVDPNVCVGCRMCERSCPENSKSKILKRASKKCYAVIAPEPILEESSSGGFAKILSQKVIEQGGIVVGAAFTTFPECRHIIVDNIDDLQRLSKSKYIYSHLDTVLLELNGIAKKQKDKKIIFFGVPCQIAAGKNILRNHTNIIYIEILCHGVMPDFVFPKYVRGLEKKYNLSGSDFRFRGNKQDTEYKVFQRPIIIGRGKKHIGLTKWNKWFLVSFLEGYAYRSKCYECNYVGQERIGDITIGDFWGLGKETSFNFSQDKGVSLVLLNSDNGIDAFEEIRHLFQVADERSINEPIIMNQTLSSPTPIPSGNKLYHLSLVLIPWNFLLLYHKVRYYYLKFRRAMGWRINKYILKR